MHGDVDALVDKCPLTSLHIDGTEIEGTAKALGRRTSLQELRLGGGGKTAGTKIKGTCAAFAGLEVGRG